MAGVSDLPFRELCAAHGAGMVVNEMVTADTRLWNSKKSRTRLAYGDTPGPRVTQIAGSEAAQMAEAARAAVAQGAQVVDINMGCPAKKVCNRAAGSALLQDLPLVQRILESVVAAVDAPVTLKIRTGWDPEHRNAVLVARLAEASGVRALTVHGRTRACRFKGEAEYATITEVVQAVAIPVIANGDITSAEKAHWVLQSTGAAAVMIGRGAQGNPWLFSQINSFVGAGKLEAKPTMPQVRNTLLSHLQELSNFYGETAGVRIARKHLGWYLEKQFDSALGWLTGPLRQEFNALTTLQEQRLVVGKFFDRLHQLEDHAA